MKCSFNFFVSKKPTVDSNNNWLADSPSSWHVHNQMLQIAFWTLTCLSTGAEHQGIGWQLQLFKLQVEWKHHGI